jgi:ribonuclease D
LQDALTRAARASGRLAWFEEEARNRSSTSNAIADPGAAVLAHTRRDAHEPARTRGPARARASPARHARARARRAAQVHHPRRRDGGIVSLRPATRDDLAQLRRLDAGARKAYGDRIVAAVAAGSRYPTTSCREAGAPPGADRDAIVACLSVLVGAIAAENELPAGLLAPRAALERVARELPATARGRRAARRKPLARELVAEPLHALLVG